MTVIFALSFTHPSGFIGVFYMFYSLGKEIFGLNLLYYMQTDGTLVASMLAVKFLLKISFINKVLNVSRRYVHSPSYGHAQEAFEAAKAANDLNAIASIVEHHPYHIESLLTFAEIFKHSGEHQSSADAIGKCLFALECAWHPLFNPLQGNCQLKYHHDTNKPLFSALFNHMKNMDKRGCHRSALEVCKLMLSLDSDDPMVALFCIDQFSLRAQEYQWLEEFAEEYRSDNSFYLNLTSHILLLLLDFIMSMMHKINKKESMN